MELLIALSAIGRLLVTLAEGALALAVVSAFLYLAWFTFKRAQKHSCEEALKAAYDSKEVTCVVDFWVKLLSPSTPSNRLTASQVHDFGLALRRAVARWLADPNQKEALFGVGLDRFGARKGLPDPVLERSARAAGINNLVQYLPQGAAVSVQPGMIHGKRGHNKKWEVLWHK